MSRGKPAAKERVARSRAEPARPGISISQAIEVFARGFAAARSFTHPFEALPQGPAWVLRDSPRKQSADYRREEFVAHGVAPKALDALARTNTRGRYCLCIVRGADEPDQAIRADCKSIGYRLGTTEPFMVHDLKRIPKVAGPFPIQRVTTSALADALTVAAGRKQILKEHLSADSPLRQYVALDGGWPVGWVRSTVVQTSAGACAWVSNMYVKLEYRRRGIGASLLAHMLREDRARGVEWSVLLSSHAGALLYPRVGYSLLGMLLLFTPPRR